MSTLFRFYVSHLKSHPLLTNLSTALVLMTTGDLMAQELERHEFAASIFKSDGHNESHPLEDLPMSRRMSLRRYGTIIQVHDDRAQRDDKSRREKEMKRSISTDKDGSATSVGNNDSMIEEMRNACFYYVPHLSDIDWIRSGAMAGWAVFGFTPFYMLLYNAMNRIFPKRTPWTILARVGASLVYSVPMNALFFTYGTCVHHTAQWYEVRREAIKDARETAMEAAHLAAAQHQHSTTIPPPITTASVDSMELPSYDVNAMLSKAKLKMEHELVTTVLNSARMWVPINFINFAIVPSHLQPFAVMFFGIFWNCYLSLVQHRDVALPPHVELEHVSIPSSSGERSNNKLLFVEENNKDENNNNNKSKEKKKEKVDAIKRMSCVQHARA